MIIYKIVFQVPIFYALKIDYNIAPKKTNSIELLMQTSFSGNQDLSGLTTLGDGRQGSRRAAHVAQSLRWSIN